MCIDYDAENWLGNPTREEMLDHFYKLSEAENELLRAEVDRYRKNQAKLIDMLSTMRNERDKLGSALNESKEYVKQLRAETYEQARSLASYHRTLAQRDSVMRSHGIKEVFLGIPPSAS